jgi:hypothetical protein
MTRRTEADKREHEAELKLARVDFINDSQINKPALLLRNIAKEIPIAKKRRRIQIVATNIGRHDGVI